MGETFTAMGRTGEYAIKKDGYHPQAGNAFHYNDRQCEFWFYVQTKVDRDKNSYELEIAHASAKRFAGGDPGIDAPNRVTIEQNIRRHFETFDLYGRPTSAANPAPTIKFTWKLPS